MTQPPDDTAIPMTRPSRNHRQDQDMIGARPETIADSVIFSPVPTSNNLVIFCSGRLMGLRVDSYSFLRQTRDLGVNRLYIRDIYGLWYQAGLAGISHDITSTADYLAGFCRRGRFETVTMVGVSSGGYGALILGDLIGADIIHSLAPRTLLHEDAENYADRNRLGVQNSLKELMQLPSRQEQFFDLRAHFRAHPRTGNTTHIYHDPAHKLDTFHAERLRGLAGMTLHGCPDTGHALGRQIITDPGFRAALVSAPDDRRDGG